MEVITFLNPNCVRIPVQNAFAGSLPGDSSAREMDSAKLFPSYFTCANLFPNCLVTTIVKHSPYYGSFQKATWILAAVPGELRDTVLQCNLVVSMSESCAKAHDDARVRAPTPQRKMGKGSIS